MGWLIFFAIVLLLGCLPLGLGVRYDEAGLEAWVLLGRLRIGLYPMPKWLQKLLQKPKPEKKKPAEPKKDPQPQPAPQKKENRDWKRFLPLVRTGVDFLGSLRRKLRVDHLTLRVIIAGEDPADVAIWYGRAWAAVGNAMPGLDRAFVIRKRDIQVECDFVGDKTRVVFGMDLTITLGRLIGLAVRYGIRVIKQFLAIQKNNKAVQVNE